MRISEHRSHDAVSKSKDRIRMPFGAKRMNKTRCGSKNVGASLSITNPCMSPLLPCTYTY